MIIKTLILLSILPIFQYASKAQGAEDVIKKSLEKRGDIQRLENFETMSITGNQRQKGMNVEFAYFVKNPNHYRMETSAVNGKNVFAYNGETVWQEINGISKITPDEIKDQLIPGLKELEGFIKGPLIGYKEKGREVELAGSVVEDGREAYSIKMIDNKLERFIFIDKSNYELFKIWLTLENTKGDMIELEMKFNDYKKIDGILYPFKMDYSIGSQGNIEILIEDFVLDTALEDSIFEYPDTEK